MSLPSEHKALIFVGAVAVLGAGVRVVRASSGASMPASQPALEHQRASADSSALATKSRAAGRSASRASRGGGVRGQADTTHRRRTTSASGDTVYRAPVAPLDRKGYVGARLDLDVATATQVDSLPGVSPAMAKRIVADRLTRGPFLNMNGLRRVSGAGPAFIARVDAFVTFSGTVVQPNANDTVISRSRRAASTKRPMR